MIAMRYRSDSDAFCFSPPSALFPMLPSLLYLCSLVIHILRLLGSICNNLVLVSHHQKFVRNLSADMRLNVVLDAGVSVVASSVAHAEYLGCSTSITVHALGNVAVMPGICWGPISSEQLPLLFRSLLIAISWLPFCASIYLLFIWRTMHILCPRLHAVPKMGCPSGIRCKSALAEAGLPGAVQLLSHTLQSALAEAGLPGAVQ
ncbi:hypothetical protein C8R47DRAFT_1322315 [Mycena vitilis]|nr:hypothetical protein C8R47DRAFT_1322253 [Mycena vitilis]KAJ6481298.1 hypothetical protein C8R47DRAFT_1322315 [Mycena vitilis]